MRNASVDFMETLLSHRQKEIFLRFQLLGWDKDEEEFIPIDEQIVEQRKLPNGVDILQGGITINTEQDINTMIDISIINHEGINNWGAEFDNKDEDDFKWWLDKRLIVDFGLRLDNTHEIEYIRMGYFLITHFKSNHTLTDFPKTEIQGSSKEVLYASRRGKFLDVTHIGQGASMVDTIKTLLLQGGEQEENFYIDPQIAKEYLYLDRGEDLYGWSVPRPMKDTTIISLDGVEKSHGESSLRIDVDVDRFIETQEQIIATKEFDFPVDVRRTNALGVWARCSASLPDGAISLLLEDLSGKIVDLPFRELVGHVIKDGKVLNISNWRQIILHSPKDLDVMTRVIKIHIKVNRTPFDVPFTLWLDEIRLAEIRNMLPYEITYGAGQNRWMAIKEIALLLDCDAYYDEFGKFNLVKKKFPKERLESDNEYFDYDAYEILTPVMTYDDQQEHNNLYAGADDVFEEHELSNHVRVIGGSTSSITTLIDMALYNDGLHIREKGKIINTRGKIRAIDQFWEGAKPTILNGDTDVGEVWKGHQNEEAVKKMYPNGFPHLTESPINNFTIERIGDFIYHHNNASHDPQVYYTYEGKNIALRELRQKVGYSEQLEILSAPYYLFHGRDFIKVKDSLLDLDENFEIKSMNIPFNGDYMSISAVKIKNFFVDVPYFDLSPFTHKACFYGYDACALAFTFPL